MGRKRKNFRRDKRAANKAKRQQRKQDKTNKRLSIKQQKQDRKDRRLDLKDKRITGRVKKTEMRTNKSMANTEARTEMNKVRAEHGMGTPAEEIAKTLGKAAIDTVGGGFSDLMDFKTAKLGMADKKNMLEVIGVNDNNDDGRTNIADIFTKKPTKEGEDGKGGIMGFFKKKPVAAIGLVVGIPVTLFVMFKTMFSGKKKRR